MTDSIHSRRRFLHSMLSLAGTSALPFAASLAAIGEAAAQTADDYKALVCLFLAGGNDGFNTVLATDQTYWDDYIKYRGTSDDSSIALVKDSLLPIIPNTNHERNFGLHPVMAGVQDLFGKHRAAIIANVGTLKQPTSRTQYLANDNLPPKLFSHNDQQSLWQSDGTEGAGLGWGGQIGDYARQIPPGSNPTFTCISPAGNAVFLSGAEVRQFQITPSGLPKITNLDTSFFGTQSTVLKAVITASSDNIFENEYANTVKRAVDAQAILSGAMLPIGTSTGQVRDPGNYTNPNTNTQAANPLAAQLQAVARIIGGRNGLSVKRQVFFVSLGGFDTHDGQKANQADLLAKVSHAVRYFDEVIEALGVGQQVTLFTASDFGRTFVTNGDGTDHGWGSHHFVFGGAVEGKEIYGTFPESGVNHDHDVGGGALLPTTSVNQYAATLASWFGVPDVQLDAIFPDLHNFPQRNLGFMK